MGPLLLLAAGEPEEDAARGPLSAGSERLLDRRWVRCVDGIAVESLEGPRRAGGVSASAARAALST